MSKELKKCVIIYPVKNDDYNKFFLNRFNYVLEHTCRLINELGLNYFFELNVVDFGSKSKISDHLNISPKHLELISFYEVEESIATKVTKKKFGYFSQPLAINIALKRLENDYLIFTSHDLIFSKVSIQNLFNFLTYKIIDKENVKNSFINIQRFFLPEDLLYKTPSYDFINYWLTKYSFLNGDVGVSTGSAFAGHLASNDLWKKIRGINERFEGYGFMDPDLHSRMNMKVPYYNSLRFGFHMYKFHRGHNNNRTNLLKFMNKNWTSLVHNENRSDWGISGYDINKTNLKKGNIIDEKNLKLGQFKSKRLSLLNFLFIFLVPIQLRLFFIQRAEIILINLFYTIFQKGDVRSFIFLGYKSPFIPLSLLKIKQALNIIIYDNLKLIVNNNSRLKELKDNQKLHSLNFQRTAKLGEAKTINASGLINHQGYFRNINSIDDYQIDKIFDQTYCETSQLILIIYESEILNIELLLKKIMEHLELINGIVIFKDTNLYKLNSLIKENIFYKTHVTKNTVILSRDKLKNLVLIEQFLKTINTNFILQISIIIRIFISLIKKISRFFSIKNFKDLGG